MYPFVSEAGVMNTLFKYAEEEIDGVYEKGFPTEKVIRAPCASVRLVWPSVYPEC